MIGLALEKPPVDAATSWGPPAYQLADWRRRVQDLYAQVRGNPTPSSAHLHWLATRSHLFATHPMSPLTDDKRATFSQIPAFCYDPDFRVEVGLSATERTVLEFDLGADGKMRAARVGETVGLAEKFGAELSLYWIEGYGGGLFLPFKDATSGTQTYGGGRYLIDALKGADLGLNGQGKLILDFNFAYTPSCAFNEEFVCPLSPPENSLPVPVTAGERFKR